MVALKIQEYPVKPVSVREKYYKRFKNTNHLLSVSEVVNLHLQSLNTSWDAYPDPMQSLDDISLDKVQRCIEIMKSRGMAISESTFLFVEIRLDPGRKADQCGLPDVQKPRFYYNNH